MEIKSAKDVKNYCGYIGIKSCLKNYNNKKYIDSDILYTELGRVSRPLYLNNDYIPCYQLIHMGGAFLSGEKYLSDIIVDDNAHIILTSQSATKVNRTKKTDPFTSYSINVELKDNSVLEFINDSIILYPESRYCQTNNFSLKSSSTLIYSDIVSSGYSGESDKKYLYDELLMVTNITIDNKLVLFDKLYYNPNLMDPGSEGVMNGYERCGNFLFISNLINHSTSQELYNLISSYNFDFRFEYGVSEFVTNAIGIRVLANETFQIESIFSLVYDYLREKYLHLEKIKLRKQPINY